MSHNLADLLPSAGEAKGLRLWLKSSAYTKRLLSGTSDSWESASKFLAYFSQAHGLLKPDVAVVEVGELFESWLQRNPALRTDLLGKRKLSYPLRKLLEQTEPRAILQEVIEAVVAHLRGQTPMILAMPSPRYWLVLANRLAGRETMEVDNDSIEDSAMYVADLARSVSNSAVGGLLIEDVYDSISLGPVDLETYRPLINVTKHYRWPLALRCNGTRPVDCAALADFDVIIGGDETSITGKVRGLDVSKPLWAGQPVPLLAAGQFHFVQIPVDAAPEAVLDSLAKLREGTD